MNLPDFVQDLAYGAGRIVKERYHQTKSWRSKTARGDVVTEVDEASERYILERIAAHCPNDRILSEESGISGGDGERGWIIDPIDGTRNYLMQIPFFCVSIATVINGVPEIGAIYDPIHDEMFFAERGKGAYLNGERITVSEDETLEDSLISLSWVKHKTDTQRFLNYVNDLAQDTSYFRRIGSAALVMSYVACGRLHGYAQGGLSPWDVAAGVVIIEEAGGLVTDFKKQPLDLSQSYLEIITANPSIHAQLHDRIGIE